MSEFHLNYSVTKNPRWKTLLVPHVFSPHDYVPAESPYWEENHNKKPPLQSDGVNNPNHKSKKVSLFLSR
jgi:hypothetical protein